MVDKLPREYDNYTYPDPPKVQTPEMKAELEKILANIRAMAERHKRELQNA